MPQDSTAPQSTLSTAGNVMPVQLLTRWLLALRPAHWSKNALLFIPLLASHRLHDWQSLWPLLTGFVSFSLLASALYLHNDLQDLANDRRHPRRRQRALAAGHIGAMNARQVSLALGAGALLIGLLLPAAFFACLLLYALLVLAYSHRLKRLFPLDLVALVAFYLLRIVAGAAASGTPLSVWLPAFATCLFLGLALLKRYRELLDWHPGASWAPPSPRYRRLPPQQLRIAGIGAGAGTVMLLCAYPFSSNAALLYPQPAWLGLSVLALGAWLAHMWARAGRRHMGSDPVLFALRDPLSLLAGLLFAGGLLLASH